MLFRWNSALLFIALVLASSTASAIDFEKKLDYDKSCLVLAMNAKGDVFLRCKDTKGILKTTVEIPAPAEMFKMMSIKEQVKMAKKAAEAEVVWSILNFSFSNQLYVLLDFNEGKTLVTGATAFFQPGHQKKLKDRIDL